MFLKNKNARVCTLLLLLLFACEHFQGRLLDPKVLILVPGLIGRWKVTQDGKVTSLLRITLNQETKTYLVEIEGEMDRSLLRFAKMDGKFIGEYHDVGETGEEISSGHIFLLAPMDSGWKVILGSDITKSMVTKYKLVAKPHKKYGKNPPSYFLSGNQEENTRALTNLTSDPDFFQIQDLKKVMFLQNADLSTEEKDPILKDFLKTFGKETHANVSEFESYYEIIISREGGGAEKYRLDKKTGKSSMIWHEHPSR